MAVMCSSQHLSTLASDHRRGAVGHLDIRARNRARTRRIADPPRAQHEAEALTKERASAQSRPIMAELSRWLRRGRPLGALPSARAAAVVIAIGSSGLSVSSARADTESVSFGVNDYGNGVLCNASDLDWSVDDAIMFMETTRDGNHFDTIYYWTQGGVDWVDLVEGQSDEVSFYGADWADITFFSGHGGPAHCPASGSRWGIIIAGDHGPVGPSQCEVRLGSSSTNMVLAEGGANSDVNYIMTHSSQTLEFCAADGGWISGWVDGGNSGTQLTMLTGFHNSPQDEDHNDTEIRDYLITSDLADVGDNWTDLLGARDGTGDDCPVVNILADTTNDAINLHDNGGINDWINTGNHDGNFYWVDCSYSECSTHPWC